MIWNDISWQDFLEPALEELYPRVGYFRELA